MVRESPLRIQKMSDPTIDSAKRYLPKNSGDLEALKRAAATCEGCPLYRHATQTVFGEGSEHAKIVLVGEQPGDEEDRSGRPFVGPAGKLLDRVLDEVGIDRRKLYVTNAVKHFKFEQSETGRRLHKKPVSREVAACRPWLEEELRAVHPKVLVLLGATAAQSVLGKVVRLKEFEGKEFATLHCKRTIVTYHPSAVLRAIDEEQREHVSNHLRAALKLASHRVG